MTLKTFYRVGNTDTGQGLWYDQKGEFTGLIHGPLGFCSNSELQMPFDPDIVGYMSVTETRDELYQWFPLIDIMRLQELGWYILEYQSDDYKQYANHWIINQQTAVLNEIIILKDLS